jgi:hypothetical protein
MRIQGKVMRKGGLPLKEVVVSIFDKRMNQCKRIGETETDANGHYTIDYDYDEKKEEPLNLLVLVGNIIDPIASDVIFKPKPVEEVNLIIRED